MDIIDVFLKGAIFTFFLLILLRIDCGVDGLAEKEFKPSQDGIYSGQ